MALLTVKERQTYLKALGFYDGRIDGLEGVKTSRAYADLQAKHFIRADDVDGKYGKNTDILLRSAYNCRNSKYFKLAEFKCKCGAKYCTGYPAEVSRDLIDNLERIRSKYGAPVKITSGLRCKTWNAKQSGSSSASRHMSGKAADFQIAGITTTEKTRKAVIAYCKTLPNHRYTYGNINGSHPNMSSSVHTDVK